MPLTRSPYFRQYSTTSESDLLDNLVVESIYLHGFETYYIPRITHNVHKLYEASDVDEYRETFPIPVYLENVLSFKGDRELMNKFAGAISIHDQIIVAIAKTTFDQEIGVHNDIARPREGDILFFPFNNRIFQIKYVDKFETLFQLGVAPYAWRVTCELFEYSNEIFSTGVEEIDSIQETASTNLYDFAIKDTDGKAIRFQQGDVWVIDGHDITDVAPLADNEDLEDMTANTIQSWTHEDPYEESGSGII